jgi:hypothetical protein
MLLQKLATATKLVGLTHRMMVAGVLIGYLAIEVVKEARKTKPKKRG